MGINSNEHVARPFWDRDESQVYPHQGYYEFKRHYPGCVFTTMNGTQCGNGGAVPLFRPTANPTLANFAVCRRHQEELGYDIYRAVVNGERGNGDAVPSPIARLVMYGERERVKRARKRVRRVEEEIKQVVEARINAPIFDPRKGLSS